MIETSDRNRTKEIRNFAKAIKLKHDTEINQPQMSSHLKTGADNVTDDETDGSDALQRPRTSHNETKKRLRGRTRTNRVANHPTN